MQSVTDRERGDMEMSELQELQQLVEHFCTDREWDQFHNPKDLAIGISTEANELLDIFRFKSEGQMEAMMSVSYTHLTLPTN